MQGNGRAHSDQAHILPPPPLPTFSAQFLLQHDGRRSARRHRRCWGRIHLLAVRFSGHIFLGCDREGEKEGGGERDGNAGAGASVHNDSYHTSVNCTIVCFCTAGRSDSYRTSVDEYLSIFWMYVMQVGGRGPRFRLIKGMPGCRACRWLAEGKNPARPVGGPAPIGFGSGPRFRLIKGLP